MGEGVKKIYSRQAGKGSVQNLFSGNYYRHYIISNGKKKRVAIA